jgi:NADH-quinone oxidoreductase subunit C
MGLSPDALLAAVREQLGDRILDAHAHCGDATVVIRRDDALEVFPILRDHLGLAFEMLTDVTAVDYLGETPRFEVVYQLNSLTQNHRLRVKLRVGEDDAWAHSLTPFWRSANWLERECWDLVGIRFVGHPDPRRILMYEEFVGHPLRRDYPVDRRQPLTPERDPIAVGWKV